MDLSGLALGLQTALQWENVLVCLIGVTLGTAVGVLPGIGATATVALLLPITFNFDAVASLIMLAGIYYGAQYGGSTTAILLNLPGESSAAVTALDGPSWRARVVPARPWRPPRWGRFLPERWPRLSSRCSPHPWPRRRWPSVPPSTSLWWCWGSSPPSPWPRLHHQGPGHDRPRAAARHRGQDLYTGRPV